MTVSDNPFAEVARVLATHADAVAARVHAEISVHIPTYDRVPRADVETSVVDIVGDVCATVRAGEVPVPGSITQAEESSRTRAKQGVPIHDIMHAFRFSMGAIRDVTASIAHGCGLDAADTVRLLTLLWSYSDAYTANVVAVYRQSDIESALGQARRAQQFLLGLLDGTLDDAARTDLASALLLDPAAPYRAVLARPVRGDVDGLLHDLQRQAARHRGASVLAALGSQVVGVVAFRPETVGDGGLVALGPAVRPDGLTDSFRSARAVLNAATAIGLGGVHALPDLSWRVVAAHSGEVDELLRERYLSPLADHGEFGALVLETVAVFLAEDRNVARAARAVPVHVNTLRHRLRRFEEITGSSLDSTETIVEVAFALGVTARRR